MSTSCTILLFACISSVASHETAVSNAVCSFTDGRCRGLMVTGDMKLYGDICS
jgi:hypothetical protein